MILSLQPIFVPNPRIRRALRKRKSQLEDIFRALSRIAEKEKKVVKK